MAITTTTDGGSRLRPEQPNRCRRALAENWGPRAKRVPWLPSSGLYYNNSVTAACSRVCAKMFNVFSTDTDICTFLLENGVLLHLNVFISSAFEWGLAASTYKRDFKAQHPIPDTWIHFTALKAPVKHFLCSSATLTMHTTEAYTVNSHTQTHTHNSHTRKLGSLFAAEHTHQSFIAWKSNDVGTLSWLLILVLDQGFRCQRV